MTATERFWRHVHKTDSCWEWWGARDKKGYGRFRLAPGHTILAHRYSWQLHKGDPGKLCVLHHCDNAHCVRPDHLWLGTRIDNNKDCLLKGRVAKGESKSKLSAQQVQDIRTYYRLGNTSQRTLARMFEVGQMTVSDIVRGKNWRHLVHPVETLL